MGIHGFLWWLSVGLFLLVAGMSCARMQSTSDSHAGLSFQPGQIYDVRQQQLLTFDQLMTQLRAMDVVYFGEAHYTPPHIHVALRVLNQLEKEGRSPVLGMEMFSWDGQAGIDRYIRREITDQEVFLQESHWKQNWGDHYEVYQPLVDFSFHHRLPLRALNPPLPLVRHVSKSGLANMAGDPEVQRWGMDEKFPVEDPDYYRVLYEQITECHPGLTKEVYQKIYEASIFRDEGMSKTITDALNSRDSSSSIIVSYTGAGHIQYGQPIPKRVVRRWGKSLGQATVYLHAYDPQRSDDVQELLDERVSDYLWLTPLGPNGPQPRCGG